MEEFPELEKLPRIITGVLKIVLCTALIALAIVLIIALGKITYTLAMMVLNTSTVVPYNVAEQAVMFFLYFGFIGLIVQYFKSGYHFPLRYFIYAGITAMMPHPERVFRAVSNSWYPEDWTEDGAWMRLFRNARVALK